MCESKWPDNRHYTLSVGVCGIRTAGNCLKTIAPSPAAVWQKCPPSYELMKIILFSSIADTKYDS
jgi:hypothetical protein